MAIQLTSGNLNQYGNAGQFETDRSTWGFTDYFGGTPEFPRCNIVRSVADAHKNSSCAQSNFKAPEGYLAIGRVSFQAGKKYTFRAWVKAPGTDLGGGFGMIYAGPDDIQIGFDLQDPLGFFFKDVAYVTGPKTLAACKDNWQFIEMYATCKNSLDLPFPLGNINTSVAWYNIATTFMRVDEFEIYEFETQSCDLLIDAAASVITHETSPGASDGSITIATSGAHGPLEYRTYGAWQDSNIFTGLPGGYPTTVQAREKNNPSCVDDQIFFINAGQNSLTFTVSVTHETSPGANDGTINVHASGTGQPYRYSKDEFVTNQPGTLFIGLPPGSYPIWVNSPSTGITVTQFVTVNAAAYAFDFTIDVNNETLPNANDGQLTVNVTGSGGPFTYSKDNGATFQSSSNFTGLPPGGYQVVVRDNSGIKRTKSVSVSAGTFGFDFSVTVTNESILGASNGTITNTVTGTGGPFQHSKDDGATWQADGYFPDLPAGTYQVRVRNVANQVLPAKAAVIAAGTIIFEKVWFSKNHIIYDRSASFGWQAGTNVRMYDDVRVDDNDNSIFVSKLKTELPPESNGNVTFQVREAFRNVLKAVPPSINSNTIIRLQDRIKFFKHYTGQMSGVQVTPAALTDSLPHLVIMGGLSKYAHSSINFFGSYLITKKKFFTWAPVEKQVDRNQEDYLNYFVFAALTTSIKRRIKAYYDDGTSQQSTVETKTGVVYGHLYQIPAGPSNSGVFAINPEKNLVSYELNLLDQNDSVISEVRTFILDRITHPRKRLFMFLNSLGAYEVLRFTGIAERSTEIQKEEIVKFLPFNYSPLDGELEVNNASIRDGGNYSTGFFDSDSLLWLDYMKDFIKSERVFEVTDGRRVPVIIQGGSFSTGIDQDYERYIRFTALDAFEDENYTPKTL